MVQGSQRAQLKICCGETRTQDPCGCLDSDPPSCSGGLIAHMSTALLKKLPVQIPATGPLQTNCKSRAELTQVFNMLAGARNC